MKARWQYFNKYELVNSTPNTWNAIPHKEVVHCSSPETSNLNFSITFYIKRYYKIIGIENKYWFLQKKLCIDFYSHYSLWFWNLTFFRIYKPHRKTTPCRKACVTSSYVQIFDLMTLNFYDYSELLSLVSIFFPSQISVWTLRYFFISVCLYI